MGTQVLQIMDALESFYKEDSGKVVEYMESMLYDWYQHYAQDNYRIEYINEVVNGAFKVNDLILKLHDIILDMMEEQDMKFEKPQQGLIDYGIAG
jgi:hypothetical protein